MAFQNVHKHNKKKTATPWIEAESSLSAIFEGEQGDISYSIILSPSEYIPSLIQEHKIREEIRGKIRRQPTSNPISTKQQIDEIRKVTGLNISEISSIMGVSRQAIYDWMQTEDLKLRRNHIEKLDFLFDICSHWKKKKQGRLGSYLYKKFTVKKISLFDALKNESKKREKIYLLLDEIELSIDGQKRKEAEERRLLQKYHFKDLSQEERDKNLNSITKTIG